MWDRLRDEGLCGGHGGRQATQAQFGQTGNQKGDVRSKQSGDQPSVEVSKEFMMSLNKLHLECSLDKELYYHGVTISVNVHIQNNSNKAVKKIKVSVRQFADICLFSTAQYKCTVDDKVSPARQGWF